MNRFALELKAALESGGAAAELDVVPAVDGAIADDANATAAADAEGDTEMEVISQTDDVIVDTSDSAEDAVVEAEVAEAAVDTEEAKADEIEEAAAGLEAIYDQLRASAKTAPLNKDTVRFANLAIESYGNRIGMADRMTLSTEGRGNTISLEGIKETLKAAWDWMVKQVQKIWAAITAFFKRMVSVAERVKQRGQKLAKLKVAGEAKVAEIEIGALAKELAIGTQVQTDANKGLADLQAIVRSDIVNGRACAEKIKAVTGNMAAYASGKLDTSTLEKNVGSMQAAFEKLSKDKKAGKVMTGNVAVTVMVKEFFGQKFAVAYLAKQAVELPESVKAKVLTQSEINSAGRAAMSAASDISAAQAQINADAKAISDALGSIKVSREFTAEERKTFNAGTSLLRFANSSSSSAALKSCSQLMKTALAYVKLAEKSAAQYSKPEAKAA